MTDLKIEFTDKSITPWGGMVLFKKMLDKIDFGSFLSTIDLPEQGSNRGYSPEQLIISFLISVWCGANSFEHLEVTRHDEAIKDIFGFKRMAGHRSFKRYFEKFDQATNQRIFQRLYEWFFSNLQFDNYTLDFDSTVITRYGNQEGAKKGYNPQKPGRNSHHPILAFIPECRMIANCWLRPGDSYTTNNFLSFLEDTLAKLVGKKVGLIRADSGFYANEIFEHLENANLNYIIACKFYPKIKQLIGSQKVWLKLGDGIEISEAEYTGNGWNKARRIIMVRQEIKIRPKAAGKQLRLFEDDGIHRNYRYSCFITSLNLSARMVYDLYRNRADSENRIKEVKNDFGFDSFNCNDFWATEATMTFSLFAYNLMSLFRQAVLNTKIHHFMKTLRYKVFAIGAYMLKKENSRILKLSLQMKRREWFEGLWSSTELMSWPLVFET